MGRLRGKENIQGVWSEEEEEELAKEDALYGIVASIANVIMSCLVPLMNLVLTCAV